MLVIFREKHLEKSGPATNFSIFGKTEPQRLKTETKTQKKGNGYENVYAIFFNNLDHNYGLFRLTGNP